MAYLPDSCHRREAGSRPATAAVRHQARLLLVTTCQCKGARVVGTGGEIGEVERLSTTPTFQPLDNTPHPERQYSNSFDTSLIAQVKNNAKIACMIDLQDHLRTKVVNLHVFSE